MSQRAASMLQLRDVAAGYGQVRVLNGLSLEVRRGEIVCLLGSNATGKTTTMRVVLGLVRPTDGSVEFDGQRLDRLPTARRVHLGIAAVPEGRRLFAEMSVYENLLMGAYARSDDDAVDADMERVYQLFPRLKERRAQAAATLSGGEQQMLAIGRALMSRPKLLLLDEPSMGLAPALVETIFETISRINRQGITILLVEQNAQMALSVAHRGYVLRGGRTVLEDRAEALLQNDEVRLAYLGKRGGSRQ